MGLSHCLACKEEFCVGAAELKNLRIHERVIDYHPGFPEQFLSLYGKESRIAGARSDQINPAFFFTHGTVDCWGETPKKFICPFLCTLFSAQNTFLFFRISRIMRTTAEEQGYPNSPVTSSPADQALLSEQLRDHRGTPS